MRDLRSAIRTLRRTPAVTLTALLVLALGIGATTAIFSAASAVLLRPLPFADPDRLVHLETMGLMDFDEMRAQAEAVEGWTTYAVVNKTLQNTADPERIAVVAAERGLFETLGVRVLAGRTFEARDPLNVAVVSEGFWQRRFGGRPSLRDWTIALDGEPFTVIGIMPARFQFPYRASLTEVWIPLTLPHTSNRFQRIDAAVGRLRGTGLDAARAELRTIAQRLEAQHPESNKGRTIEILPLTEVVVGRSRAGLLTLLGAVVMVLLIACANVTTLLLARAEARRQEVAIRTALGAGRGRLLRQFLIESLLLACGGGVAALFVAVFGTSLLVALAGAAIPRSFEIGLDWRVFLFVASVCMAAGVAFGIAPAFNATRTGPGDVLKTLNGGRTIGGRASSRMHRALVIAEIGLAFILLIGAGLLRAFLQLERTPTGLVAEHVLTLRMETRGLLSRSGADEGASLSSPEGRYFRAIEARVRQVAGVRTAGVVTQLPIQSPGGLGAFEIAGQPAETSAGAAGRRPSARLRSASPGYFRALGIPLRRGRLFSDRDDPLDARAILVNDALVRQHFPGEDPIGRVLDRGTIVGVVGDVRQRLALPAEPEIYAPLARASYTAATLVVSASVPVDQLVKPIRAAIRDVNPHQAVFDVTPMDRVIAGAHGDVNLSLWLIAAFAGLALVLSLAGIYGVIAYAVASRRKELGIRLALGADARSLLWLVLGQGGTMIAGGIVLGIAGALALTRFLRALLYGITPTDPLTFALVTLLLIGVALTACLNPARRAMRLDPIAVLRDE